MATSLEQSQRNSQMETIKLVVRKDNETGENGLVLADMRNLATFSVSNDGRQIAHDILEHQNGPKAIGGVADELEALGGIWYVRGEYNDITRDHNLNTVYDHLGSDLMRLAEISIFSGVPYRMDVPVTEEHGEDEEFEAIIQNGKRELINGFGDELDTEEYEALEQFCNDALHFIRNGYEKAAKRFPKQCTVNDMFWIVAEAVDSIIDHADSVGQEFELTIDFKNHKASCEEFYDYDEWDEAA